jgi:4-carboxymuconolactone decarboxylase
LRPKPPDGKRRGAPDAARRDRMPPIPAAGMTRAQKKAARELASGRRGQVIGPFVAALRSPELMSRLQRLGEYLRYESSLGPRLTELVILLTAREWTQQFEWALHVATAAEQGLKPGVIEAIAEGRRPRGMAKDEAVVYDFFTELQRARSVSDATYARAVDAFGEPGVIDLIGIAGYYATLAMILNVARTPLPAGRQPLLAPFPVS